MEALQVSREDVQRVIDRLQSEAFAKREADRQTGKATRQLPDTSQADKDATWWFEFGQFQQ